MARKALIGCFLKVILYILIPPRGWTPSGEYKVSDRGGFQERPWTSSSNMRAARKTSWNMGTVSFPVKVFCWLGW